MTDRAHTRSMGRPKESPSPERQGSGLDDQASGDGRVSPSGPVVPAGGTGSVGPTSTVTTSHGYNTESGNKISDLVDENEEMASKLQACNTRLADMEALLKTLADAVSKVSSIGGAGGQERTVGATAHTDSPVQQSGSPSVTTGAGSNENEKGGKTEASGQILPARSASTSSRRLSNRRSAGDSDGHSTRSDHQHRRSRRPRRGHQYSASSAYGRSSHSEYSEFQEDQQRESENRRNSISRERDGRHRRSTERSENSGSSSRSSRFSESRSGSSRRRDRRRRDRGVRFESDSDSPRRPSRRQLFPKNRQDDLVVYREALADREDAIQWLYHFRNFSDDRKWTKEQKCTLLPLVWKKDENDERTRRWYNNLSSETQTRYTRLERAFIKKFAEDDIRKHNNMLLTNNQPRNSTCEDWFLKVCKQHKQLRAWAASSPELQVVSESYFLGSLQTRFTNNDMITLLPVKSGGTDTSDEGAPMDERTLLRLCIKADKLTRKRQRHKHRQVEPDKDLDNDIYVRSLIGLEFSDDGGDEIQREYAAEVYLIDRGVKSLSTTLVARVMDKISPRGPVAQKSLADMKSFLNVMHRNHGANSEQICAFHSCKPGGCNRSECRWEHSPREAKLCTKGAEDTEACPHGAWCRYRHKDDMYVIWFYNRKSKHFAKYIWRDYKSSFSRYYSGRRK